VLILFLAHGRGKTISSPVLALNNDKNGRRPPGYLTRSRSENVKVSHPG
jgi:predicted aconitase with swiveling domain